MRDLLEAALRQLSNNLSKAKEHLATLDKLCFFSCEEYRDLMRAEHIARALGVYSQTRASGPPSPAPERRSRAPAPTPPLMVETKAASRWRDLENWVGIVAGAAVFVAALAVPLDDTALLLALVLALRGGRRALDTEPATVADSRRATGGSIMSTGLVVDDRPNARYSMARPLTAAGFDVRETATGRDALRLARLQTDVIVLDLALPDMDGFEVLRRLKADAVTVNIPAILKTAHAQDGHRQRGLEAGAADYFAEPFDPQALVTVVRRVLGEGASSVSKA